MRVLVVEAIAPEGLAYLREHGVDVDELAKASPAELRARLPDYEGLITRSGTAVTAELLRSEEHTSELQSQSNLVCRLLLEKKKHNRSSRACRKPLAVRRRRPS